MSYILHLVSRIPCLNVLHFRHWILCMCNIWINIYCTCHTSEHYICIQQSIACRNFELTSSGSDRWWGALYIYQTVQVPFIIGPEKRLVRWLHGVMQTNWKRWLMQMIMQHFNCGWLGKKQDLTFLSIPRSHYVFHASFTTSFLFLWNMPPDFFPFKC